MHRHVDFIPFVKTVFFSKECSSNDPPILPVLHEKKIYWMIRWGNSPPLSCEEAEIPNWIVLWKSQVALGFFLWQSKSARYRRFNLSFNVKAKLLECESAQSGQHDYYAIWTLMIVYCMRSWVRNRLLIFQDLISITTWVLTFEGVCVYRKNFQDRIQRSTNRLLISSIKLLISRASRANRWRSVTSLEASENYSRPIDISFVFTYTRRSGLVGLNLSSIVQQGRNSRMLSHKPFMGRECEHACMHLSSWFSSSRNSASVVIFSY
jgi:hypothetical protein